MRGSVIADRAQGNSKYAYVNEIHERIQGELPRDGKKYINFFDRYANVSTLIN